MAKSREYKNYLRRARRIRPEVRAKEKEYRDRWVANHPEYREHKKEVAKEYYKNNRSKVIQSISYYNSRSCRDPVAGDVCKYNTLIRRKINHPDLYEGIVIKDCLIKVPTIKNMDDDLKKEYGML